MTTAAVAAPTTAAMTTMVVAVSTISAVIESVKNEKSTINEKWV
jgi:hypothetical protein